MKRNDRRKVIPFWKAEDPYGIFCQWYHRTMMVEGVEYICCEQYMMAAKARLFDDFDTEAKILGTSDPAKHKKFGREVKNFSQKVWDENCQEIVYQANLAKFGRDEGILTLLLLAYLQQTSNANYLELETPS
jgi:ribA/ribD-fused uncharacterized protein